MNNLIDACVIDILKSTTKKNDSILFWRFWENLVVCIMILLMLSSYQVKAQQSSLRYELFEHKLFVGHTNNQTDTMRYRLLYPKNYNKNEADIKKYPLVLFLHGAGERGDSSLTVKHIGKWFLQENNRDKYECFVLVPECAKRHRWVEVDWGDSSHSQPQEMSRYLNLTTQLLEKTKEIEQIDKQRVYLTGLSMGGYGAWDLAARFPDTFAALVPICGGADEGTALSLKDTPIWAFHGALDTVVLPHRSKNMVSSLHNIGNENVVYTEYPNIRHGSWIPAYSSQEMWDWMFSQIKN